jgi:hypothetical protein
MPNSFLTFAQYNMKAFVIILSVYCILLSGIPCADIDVTHASANASYSLPVAPDNHNDADHCSPFCTCQCCQAYFQVSVRPVELPVNECTIAYHEIRPDLRSIDLFDFLIPPKS